MPINQTLKILCILVIFSCGMHDKNSPSQMHSDSGVNQGTLRQLQQYTQQTSQQFSAVTELIPINIPLPGFTYRGHIVKIYDKSFTGPGSRKLIQISAATHGNEYLGIEHQLTRYIARQAAVHSSSSGSNIARFIDEGGVFIIVPVVNPSGFSSNVRNNFRDMDLNRDFPLQARSHQGRSQQETNLWLSILDREIQNFNYDFVLSLDYHCCFSTSRAALVYPWGFTNHQSRRYLPNNQEIFNNLQTLQSGGNRLEIGNVIDILEYPAVGASDDSFFERYFLNKQGDSEFRISLTYEGIEQTGQQNPNRLDVHTAMWENIAGYYVR